MTPEVAVASLVDILATRAELTEDEVYAAMADAGIPDPIADRAYKFTQIAWGRVLLDGLGVQFAPDYMCFSAAGDVIESGRLDQQPYFVAALAAARRHPPPRGLPRFALMSADVSAINSAIHNGSKPADLVTGPSALFMESPSPAGIDKARRLLLKKQSVPARSGSGLQGGGLPATTTAASRGQAPSGPAPTAMPTLIAVGSVLIWFSIVVSSRTMGWRHVPLGEGGWALLLAAVVGVGLGAVAISKRGRALYPRVTLAIGILGV